MGLGGCWQRHGDGAAEEPAAPVRGPWLGGRGWGRERRELAEERHPCASPPPPPGGQGPAGRGDPADGAPAEWGTSGGAGYRGQHARRA